MKWTKKIHLSFYFLDDKMPESVAQHVKDVELQNPDFQVLVWGPQESRALVESRYPAFLAKYDAYPHAIQRSDFSRYAILHAFGGVYFDMDYTLQRPVADIFAFLDDTFQHEAVFVNETPNAVLLRRLSNSFMIARYPGHAFWMHVMQTTNSGTGLSSHQRILTSTGPQAVDRAYRSFKTQCGVGILPKQYFNPCGLCSRGTACQKGDMVLAFHENAGGWNSSTSRMYNSLHCNMGWWVLSLLFLIAVIVLACCLATTQSRCRQRQRQRN